MFGAGNIIVNGGDIMLWTNEEDWFDDFGELEFSVDSFLKSNEIDLSKLLLGKEL